MSRFTISTRDPRNVRDAETGLIAGFTTTEGAREALTLLESWDERPETYAWWKEADE